MNKADRAKQFMPFDALKGLQEALRAKEIEYEEKRDLCEDSYIELQDEINKIEKGCEIKIRYYKNKKYVDILGVVTDMDYIKKKIQIDEYYNINICDIIKIEVV